MKKHEVIGLNNGLKMVFKKIRKVAHYPVNILLTGESGTGKEVIAGLVHNLSPRKNNRLIKINCAAIPDNLLESELFGYVKGAFTGAVVDKPGKIELAHKGTLFLDELGEIKADLQAKLLRVLQEKEVERVGGTQSVAVDFRLICATNRDLKKEVAEKRFREDLYYRISTFPVHLPPLRERKHDIKELLDFFVRKFSQEIGITPPAISECAIALLQNYSWPGNIREMQNVIQRVILSMNHTDLISAAYFDLMHEKKDHNYMTIINSLSKHIISTKIPIKKVEKDILSNILKAFEGNGRKAARETMIPKDKFYRLNA